LEEEEEEEEGLFPSSGPPVFGELMRAKRRKRRCGCDRPVSPSGEEDE